MLGVFRRAKVKDEKGAEIVVIDFSDKTVKLPNGDIVRRDDIISYDPTSRTLLYRGPSGELKTLHLPAPENDAAPDLIARLVEALARQRSGMTPLWT